MVAFDWTCGIGVSGRTIWNLFYQATDFLLNGKPKNPDKRKRQCQ